MKELLERLEDEGERLDEAENQLTKDVRKMVRGTGAKVDVSYTNMGVTITGSAKTERDRHKLMMKVMDPLLRAGLKFDQSLGFPFTISEIRKG